MPGSVTSFRVDQEVTSILEVDNEVVLSSSLGPPQKVIDLVLFRDVVRLRVGVLCLMSARLPRCEGIIYLVNVVWVDTITSFLCGGLDSLLHHFSDVLLALLVVDVHVPLVPLAEPVLERVGTGTHALLVHWDTFSTVTFGFKVQLVTTVVETRKEDDRMRRYEWHGWTWVKRKRKSAYVQWRAWGPYRAGSQVPAEM
jgi:hypothetical protein